METKNNTNVTNYDNLHKLFKDYHVELNRVIDGLLDNSISKEEVKVVFKKLDKMKGRIRTFGKRFYIPFYK